MTSNSLFFTNISSNHAVSHGFAESVTSVPIDDIIAQQLASLVDSTKDALQKVCAFLFAPLSFDSMNRVSMLMLLFERTVFRPALQSEKKLHMLQTYFRSNDNEPLLKDQLVYLVVIFSAGLSRECRHEEPSTLGNPPENENRSSDPHILLNERLFLITNLIFSVLCFGSLLPMVMWCITTFYASRPIRGETTFLALVSIWISCWATDIASE